MTEKSYVKKQFDQAYVLQNTSSMLAIVFRLVLDMSNKLDDLELALEKVRKAKCAKKPHTT